MLINLVFMDGYSIARAIKKLNLKLTTARFIIQKYRQSGSFPMKHFKKNLRMLRDLEENDPCSNAVKQEEPLLQPSPKVEEGEHAYTYPKDEHLPAESIYWYYASSPFFFHQSQ